MTITVKHYMETERLVLIQDGVKQAECKDYELDVLFEDIDSLLASEFGEGQPVIKYIEIEEEG